MTNDTTTETPSITECQAGEPLAEAGEPLAVAEHAPNPAEAPETKEARS